MREDTKRWKAREELREIVSQQGLAQYPLAMVVAVWSLYLLMKRREWRLRAVAFTALALALVSLGIAFHRAYLTSLGW